jgi:hypothetical protein
MGNTEATRPVTWAFSVERVTGIEPALSAWEADGSLLVCRVVVRGGWLC